MTESSVLKTVYEKPDTPEHVDTDSADVEVFSFASKLFSPAQY